MYFKAPDDADCAEKISCILRHLPMLTAEKISCILRHLPMLTVPRRFRVF